jgi:tetratricopeptide (TPR) repeat protein
LKTYKFFRSFTIFLFVLLPVLSSAQDLDSNHPLMRGIEFFREGMFNEAMTTFRYVLTDPSMVKYYPDAYFWLAKSDMGVDNLDDAAKNLEYFISRFPSHYQYPEALYQKGRLLFLQNDFENCISALTDFAEKYSSSPFASNAYFWIGESLFMLGNFDDASKIYAKIVQSYPDSFKFEAAKYRIALIEFKKREDELLKLLKWSHMETMKTQEEFKKREKTYEQAVASYQKKLAVTEISKGTGTATTDRNTQADLAKKDKDLEKLRQENAALKKQIEYLSQAATGIKPFDSTSGQTTGTGITQTEQSKQLENQERLLRMKEEALTLKEEMLKVLEKALEGE